jgi:hypothetical protein
MPKKSPTCRRTWEGSEPGGCLNRRPRGGSAHILKYGVPYAATQGTPSKEEKEC